MSFGHRAHLELAFDALEERGIVGAVAEVADRLSAKAAEAGAEGVFDPWLTVRWLVALETARRAHPGLGLEALVAVCPELLDQGAVRREGSPAGPAGSRAAPARP